MDKILLSLLIVTTSLVFGQHDPHEFCGTMFRHNQLMQTDPEYRARRAEIAKQHKNIEKQLQGQKAPILTVPVVVHVIHTGQSVGSGANISDAQIQSAINALNEDFRRMAGTNGFGGGVDTEIEFCLAVRDPNGQSTSGINRVDGSSVSGYSSGGMRLQTTSGASETSVKALSRWPKASYYNIWIVTEIDGNNGGSGTQGFAYFPGASSSVDGAVILYNAFGTTGNLKGYTDMNRTATHEIGHGLDLYHTFEGDNGGGSCPPSGTTQGDEVADTPPHRRSSSNCPSSNSNPCVSGGSLGDVVHNYMDYSSQTCKDEFTAGQSTRMRTALQGSRSSLLTSSACLQDVPNDITLSSLDFPGTKVCAGTFSPVLTIKNSGTNTISSFDVIYDIDGGTAQVYSWTGALTSGSAISVTVDPISNLSNGGHTLNITVTNPNNSSDPNPADNSDSQIFNYSPVKPVINLVTNDFMESSLNLPTYIWLRENVVRPNLVTRSVKPLWDGNYRVIAIDNVGCASDTSDPYGYFFTGLLPEDENSLVKIYPNPATSAVTIELPVSDESSFVQLFNTRGQLILEQTLTETRSDINISGIENGIYMIRIAHPGGIKTSRFTKL